MVGMVVDEGAGVRLKRSIATATLDNLDPFLLFDHFGSKDPADYIKGFPMHPHRGIETVTYMIQGAVDHKDSIGNSGSISSGDIQWMTAGAGIVHEEMPAQGDEDWDLWISLVERGLKGVQLVISDAHEGLKAARRAVFGGVPWQRCQFHLQQNAQSYVPRQSMKAEVAADIRAIFNAATRPGAEVLLAAMVEKYEKRAYRLAT